MKKPYFLRVFIALFTAAVLFFGTQHIANADVDTAQSIDQTMNTDLAAAPNKKINIQFIDKKITENSAQFSISLRPIENTPTIIVVSVWDAGNNQIVKEPVFTRTVFTVGDFRKLLLRDFTNLKAGTVYTLQITDTAQSSTDTVRYQKISFTTLGKTPDETTEPIATQKASLTVTPTDPAVESATTGSNENYKVTFAGKFISTLNLRTNLQLYMGEQANNLSLRGTLFTNSVIPQNIEQTYSLTIPNLKPNTTYYYKIHESTKNFDPIADVKSFTTPLDGSALESTAPIADQKAAITITMDTPIFNVRPTTVGSTYDATFSGKVITTLNTRVGLAIWMGQDSTSIFKAGNVLLYESLIFKGVEKKFSQIIPGLQPGTKYYYKIQETSKNFFTTTQPLSFTTPGTAPVTNTSDPMVGALDQYTFPTDIGQPTGDVTANSVTESSPLVPCGKRSDQNNPDTKNCRIQDLLTLVARVIDYLLVLLVPLTVLVAIYTGVQMVLHRGVPADLLKYKDNLIKIGWGVAVMLLAWTIIATLLKTFVDPGATRFILLDLL